MGGFRIDLGTWDGADNCEDVDVEVGSCRRELKLEMNSIDCGDSPRRLLK